MGLIFGLVYRSTPSLSNRAFPGVHLCFLRSFFTFPFSFVSNAFFSNSLNVCKVILSFLISLFRRKHFGTWNKVLYAINMLYLTFLSDNEYLGELEVENLPLSHIVFEHRFLIILGVLGLPSSLHHLSWPLNFVNVVCFAADPLDYD